MTRHTGRQITPAEAREWWPTVLDGDVLDFGGIRQPHISDDDLLELTVRERTCTDGAADFVAVAAVRTDGGERWAATHWLVEPDGALTVEPWQMRTNRDDAIGTLRYEEQRQRAGGWS